MGWTRLGVPALVLSAVAGLLAGALSLATPATAAVGGTGTVAAFRLNVRTGPSTNYQVVRVIKRGARVGAVCKVAGEMIRGSVRTTSYWDRLTDGRYLSDAYVSWRRPRPAIPLCAVPAKGVDDLRLRANASSPLPVVRTARAVDPPPASGEPFIRWAAGFAQQSARLHRVPASVAIAQAILESGWGRSGLTRDANSYFGMKCFGTPGPIALGCRTYRTHECRSNGTCHATTASFRVYGEPWSSFKDHGRALATLTRYRNAFKYVNNPNQFAIEIHKAGYATGPTYSRNLINLMKKYNLYRFDRFIPPA